MQTTHRILDTQIAMRAPVGGAFGNDATTDDFRAALRSADARGSGDAGRAEAPENEHIVRAGETLYGIARKRLAAEGRVPTPADTMRYALQIAQANEIRNPDRIQIGQHLGLDAVGGPIAVPKANAGVIASAAIPRAATLQNHEARWETRIIEKTGRDDADDFGHDVERLAAVESPEPTIEQSAATVSAEPLAAERFAARAALAAYEQVAPAKTETPTLALPDLAYKGIVGKALDILPLEPATRTGLQQANAVIGSSIAGRSLAALTGVGGPLLTLVGLAWGLFSAQKIGDAQTALQATAEPPPSSTD